MNKQAYALSLLGIVMLQACGGAAQSPALPTQSHSVSIAYGFEPQSTNSSQSPIVLWDQQWFDTIHASYYLVPVVTPTISPMPSDSWLASNSAVQLSNQEPFTVSAPGAPAPTAAPGDTYIQTGAAYGKSTITLNIGSPINSTATIDTVHFGSLEFGCAFRYQPSFAFGSSAQPLQNASSFTSGDLYDTSPASGLQPLDPCYNSSLATGSEELWHVPYGGTITDGATVQQFLNATTSDWRNDGTTFQANSSGLLIFKTASGKIVKALLPIGPYEVSDSSGQFAY